MLLMINKNPGAYFFFYLTSVVGMDEQFVQRVVSGTVDPTFVRDIKNCEWDKDKRVLTTSEDAHNEKLEEMEKVVWYMDAYGDNVFDMSKKEKGKKFSALELEDLHAANLVKTASKKTVWSVKRRAPHHQMVWHRRQAMSGKERHVRSCWICCVRLRYLQRIRAHNPWIRRPVLGAATLMMTCP